MRTASCLHGLILSLGLLAAGAVVAQTTPAGNSTPSGASSAGQSGGTPPAPAPASSQASQAPMGGSGFGAHVSGMAPAHAIDHRRMFGDCVSAMAQGLDCEQMMTY